MIRRNGSPTKNTKSTLRDPKGRPMADDRHDWFQEQIFRHRAALHRYLRRFTSGAEDVDDLVQETFVRMYAMPDYREVGSARALLFRVAHNLAVERARRQSTQATDSVGDLEALSVYSTEAPADEQIDARRRFESFCAAVDRLPPLCRRVFVLRKVYRLSHDEIAEVLGISHSTIEKHVAKGLIRCRDYLRESGLMDAAEGKALSASADRVRDGRTEHMSKILRLRTRAEIDEEAAAWAWRMDSDAVTADEREAFESWLRQDPRHRRASEEMCKAWAALDGLAARRDDKFASFTRNSRRFGTLERKGRWSAAAAAVLVGIAATLWFQTGRESLTLATAVGQQRSVTLADGSIVTLNTNTIVETDLNRRAREIHLRKGEAHFQVAHDRSRPFLVHAGDAVVRAVGTQFEVRVFDDQHDVDVVVNEGRVDVQPAVATPTPAIAGAGTARIGATPSVQSLRAGQQLSSVGGSYAVTRVSAAQLSSALAWREGAVVFDGEPLSEAIAEIERYTDARIVINDPQTAGMRLGGRFRTGDIQEFFGALQTALPVTVRRTPDGVVFIDPRL